MQLRGFWSLLKRKEALNRGGISVEAGTRILPIVVQSFERLREDGFL